MCSSESAAVKRCFGLKRLHCLLFPFNSAAGDELGDMHGQLRCDNGVTPAVVLCWPLVTRVLFLGIQDNLQLFILTLPKTCRIPGEGLHPFLVLSSFRL